MSKDTTADDSKAAAAAEGPSAAKKSKTIEKDEEDLEELSEDEVEEEEGTELDKQTQDALLEIDKVQNEIDGLNEKASEEILGVEIKYNKLRKPMFDKRNEAIEKIAEFWVNVMINHPKLTTFITEKDEEILGFLSKLEMEEFEDIKSGFRIKFTFNSNPYFENETIVKEFHLQGDNTKSTSTLIKWKAGKDVTGGIKKNYKSFFIWFNDHSDPEGDDIAEIIKEELWPNPLQFYLHNEESQKGYGYDYDEDGDESDGLEEGEELVEDEEIEGELGEEEEDEGGAEEGIEEDLEGDEDDD